MLVQNFTGCYFLFVFEFKILRLRILSFIGTPLIHFFAPCLDLRPKQGNKKTPLQHELNSVAEEWFSIVGTKK